MEGLAVLAVVLCLVAQPFLSSFFACGRRGGLVAQVPVDTQGASFFFQHFPL